MSYIRSKRRVPYRHLHSSKGPVIYSNRIVYIRSINRRTAVLKLGQIVYKSTYLGIRPFKIVEINTYSFVEINCRRYIDITYNLVPMIRIGNKWRASRLRYVRLDSTYCFAMSESSANRWELDYSGFGAVYGIDFYLTWAEANFSQLQGFAHSFKNYGPNRGPKP